MASLWQRTPVEFIHKGRAHCVTRFLSVYIPMFTERHDALYVVGSLDETLELRGMRYHPIDIETSVIRAHRSIAEW